MAALSTFFIDVAYLIQTVIFRHFISANSSVVQDCSTQEGLIKKALNAVSLWVQHSKLFLSS